MARPPSHDGTLSPNLPSAAGLRTGYTTGTCSAAAAKAAVAWLSEGRPPGSVEIVLPGGGRVAFPVVDVSGAEPFKCAVEKDAGDDPDVTHRAHLTVAAAWAAEPARGTGRNGGEAVSLRAGAGVGVVTLPGLGLAVGAPAITAVPARMIRAAVAEVTSRPVTLTISVPGGTDMAAKTSNARLGIVGGISILGTTGIVRPFSTAAWRASVVQQVDVAAAQGQDHIVLSTGGRTDAFAQRRWPALPVVCFVEVGDFTG
ncbi:MAG: cobalt-precorrin-5B (C(1))-methyltransferase CbiD, partial [Acidimicrobiales bacterium]